jgi:uncharacterized protein
MASFAGAYTQSPEEAARNGPASKVVLFTIDLLVEGKFYALFSLLLGAGYWLQRERFRGDGFDAFFRRRMLVLIAIGAAHMALLWHGDILLLYGVMGLALPFLARLRRRAPIALALLAMPVVIHGLIEVSGGALDPLPWFRMLAAEWRRDAGFEGWSMLQQRQSADWFTVWAGNFQNVLQRPGAYLQAGRPFKVLGLFLLGCTLASLRPWELQWAKALRRALQAGLVVGLCGSWVYAGLKSVNGGQTLLPGWTGIAQTIGYHAGSTPLALAYASAVLLSWPRPVLLYFVPLGRMALTVYITQTVLQLLLFYGYGLGLTGHFPFWAIPLLAGAILMVQQRLCALWLARFGQGPLERMWRRVASSGCVGRTAPLL